MLLLELKYYLLLEKEIRYIPSITLWDKRRKIHVDLRNLFVWMMGRAPSPYRLIPFEIPKILMNGLENSIQCLGIPKLLSRQGIDTENTFTL
jgi:hypothetical protein